MLNQATKECFKEMIKLTIGRVRSRKQIVVRLFARISSNQGSFLRDQDIVKSLSGCKWFYMPYESDYSLAILLYL